MTNMIKDVFDKQVLELKKLWANKRQLLFQLLNLAMIVFSALMIWKALMCYTKVCCVEFSLVYWSIVSCFASGVNKNRVVCNKIQKHGPSRR